MSEALLHGFGGRRLNMGWRVEVRLAECEARYVLALGAQLARALRHAYDGPFIGLRGAAGEEGGDIEGGHGGALCHGVPGPSRLPAKMSQFLPTGGSAPRGRIA